MTIALAITLLVLAVFAGRDIAQRREIRVLKADMAIDERIIKGQSAALRAARADARAERACADKLIAAEQRRVQLLDENRRNADRAFGPTAGPLS